MTETGSMQYEVGDEARLKIGAILFARELLSYVVFRGREKERRAYLDKIAALCSDEEGLRMAMINPEDADALVRNMTDPVRKEKDARIAEELSEARREYGLPAEYSRT